MSILNKIFNSSIGKKYIMALTGLFLCTFLVVHLIGNMQLFKSDFGLAFNSYAVFMTHNPLIKTVSYLLYATILFHAFKGLYLVYKNKKARPVTYEVNHGGSSFWASRWMGVLGTIILVFIVTHMVNFWGEYKFGFTPWTKYEVNLKTNELVNTIRNYEGGFKEAKVYIEGETEIHVYKDLAYVVENAFKNPIVVLFYVLSMIALAFHLVHGFKSAFQSLGINHQGFNGLISSIGVWIFGIIIPALFASMPIYFFLK